MSLEWDVLVANKKDGDLTVCCFFYHILYFKMWEKTFQGRPADTKLVHSKELVEYLTWQRGKLLPALYVPDRCLTVKCCFQEFDCFPTFSTASQMSSSTYFNYLKKKIILHKSISLMHFSVYLHIHFGRCDCSVCCLTDGILFSGSGHFVIPD